MNLIISNIFLQFIPNDYYTMDIINKNIKIS